MAISLVGSEGGLVGGSDLDVDLTPYSLAENDVVVVHLCRRATSDTTPAMTSAGYTAAYANVYSNSTNDSNLRSFYKVMGATPDSTATITTTGFGNTQSYALQVFRGVDPTTPLGGITPTTATSSGVGSPNAPAITPTDAGSWIVAAGGVCGPTGGTGTTAITVPSNMTDLAHGENDRAVVGAALKTDWASGAFDPATFGGGSIASGNGISAATFVLKPAAGGSGVTGSLAATESGSDTASFSGAVEVSGSLAASETGSDTAAISGTVKVQGSLSATEAGSDAAAFSGTVTAAAITGTLAATETGSDTASLSGTVEVSGSLDATETGADVAAFAGFASQAENTGTMAASESGADYALFAGIIDNAFLRYRRRRRGAAVISGR